MLYQLSYAPGLQVEECSLGFVQRRALALLFSRSPSRSGAIAVYADVSGGRALVIGAAAAAALALWMADLARRVDGGRKKVFDRRTAYSLPVSVKPGSDTQALWQEYRKTRDQALRDRLILTYAPLVKFVAGRLGASLPAHVDEQDLVSYGLLGLIGAIERFDPDREIKFETYAISRIKGAIIDELRSLDWVPRSVRTRAREIERAIAELERRLHRAPTDEEIAAKVGITTEELEDSLSEISRSSMAALDELWSPSGGGDQIALIDTIEDDDAPDPEFSLEQTEMKEALGEAIARLPEREKLVVTLYYYEELTLREIGEVLGVTESRVSQLHTKAVLRLKARLSGGMREPAET